MADNSAYAALKAYGHSPFKAAEIALDARRGDHYAVQHLELARRSVASDKVAAAA